MRQIHDVHVHRSCSGDRMRLSNAHRHYIAAWTAPPETRVERQASTRPIVLVVAILAVVALLAMAYGIVTSVPIRREAKHGWQELPR